VSCAETRPPRLDRALPRLLVLTDRHQATAELHEVVARAIEGGARAVVLRDKDLPRDERAELALRLAPLLHAVDGLLLSAGELLPGCDGVHLPSPSHDRRRHLPPVGCLVGRSCHDAAELADAQRQGAHYVTVSPVFASSSKPGHGPALGREGLAGLVEQATVPVYALGGIEAPAHARACQEAGAAGVAVMGAVMRATDPAAVVARLLRALETEVRVK
jgi:thiamine-phosphate diphosphorylase